jgi:hypothetical protein
LYAVNCPFKNQIPKIGWISIQKEFNPPPNVTQIQTNCETTTTNIDDEEEEEKEENNNNNSNSNSNNNSNQSPSPKNKNKSNKKNKQNKKSRNNMRMNMRQEVIAIHNENIGKNKNTNINVRSIEKYFLNNHSPNELLVISGGQTGVDRAAFDTSLAFNIPIGGWCPNGRMAEDGIIDDQKYPNLKETDSSEYSVRSLYNVIDSHATLMFNIGRHVKGGTLETRKYCAKYNKEFMFITLHTRQQMQQIFNENQDEEQISVGQFLKDEDEESNNNNSNSNNNTDTNPKVVICDFSDSRTQRVAEWIRSRNIRVLNISGARESEQAQIYEQTCNFLRQTFEYFVDGQIPKQCLFQM